MSRTKNTIRNMKWGLINKLVLMILPFVMRTIIIKCMGSEFAGLNSLFTSILQVLNLAELGVGSAITFSLYKPLAEKDTETVRATINLYKKIYRIIGIVVLIIGLALLPFINLFISGDVPENINIYILFGIYLLNTVLTYFLFAYKTTLFEANQRNDIISNINTALYVIQFIYQAIVIMNFKNYYAYIVIMPLITIVNNLIGAYYAKKMYPEYYCSGSLDAGAKNNIKKRVYGLMIQKVCQTTRNSLDSIFISAFLGLNIVAMYNNYYMILSAVIALLSVITTSMVSSIGNSVATENIKKNYDDMNKFNFIYMWISGWCTVCLVCLYQPFMKIWLGESYMFSYITVILFCLYFYSLKMGDILSAYNQGAGLWWEGKYRALAETLLNIVLNVILGKLFGVNGIILGTLISLLLINFGYGSTIVFKHYFKDIGYKEYFMKHLLYFGVTLAICVIMYFVTGFININMYVDFIIIGILCIIVPNVFYYLVYRKYYLFKESVEFAKKIVKRK
ncbi:MAG: oligosaccharide flippase family protein [Clostridia bacterium]|nr:oligosaccharide flippase family protein [Clostridia bacterium]